MIDSGSVNIIDLIQWAILEDSGYQVMESLKKFTPDINILEHYNNFF
jgi:hypothetical protein